jgi:hypothetical protein
MMNIVLRNSEENMPRLLFNEVGENIINHTKMHLGIKLNKIVLRRLVIIAIIPHQSFSFH